MLRCIQTWLNNIGTITHVADAWLTHKNALHQRRIRTEQTSIRQSGRRLRLALMLASFFLALCTVSAIAWPLHAAMILNYFDVLVDAEKVTLEWSTASENEVLGFEIECKKEDEPISRYHLIGKRIAQGNKDQGAIYRFDLFEGLEPNTSYCFRLREITLNNEQGEVIDRCGYGLNITPTPAATPLIPLELTPLITTTITTTSTTAFSPTVVVTTTVIQPIVVTAIPSSVITSTVITSTDTSIDGQALPEQPMPPDTSVIPTPVIPTETPTPFSESPLPPPITTTATLSAFEQSSASALANQTAPVADASTTSFAAEETESSTVVADPAYIILTVTPTPVAMVVAPTFTPFPTAVLDAEANLISTTLPNTQNLMILLLCGVFSGASGLGILGLVTTLLYMRSRTAEQQIKRKQ